MSVKRYDHMGFEAEFGRLVRWVDYTSDTSALRAELEASNEAKANMYRTEEWLRTERDTLQAELAALREALRTIDGRADWCLARGVKQHGTKALTEICNVARAALAEQRLAAAEADARNNFNQEFFALRDALRDWPKLPPGYVLKWLHFQFPEDWERGVGMQRELGLSVIPPKTECEGGAGMWDRITGGAWRAALSTTANKASEGEGR